MFVDELTIKLIAGSGGDGCTSFRREKYVPMGGPDGGNGGRGASIVFKVDKGLKTLVDLSYKKIIKGSKGENGKGKNMYGKNAEDIIILVPEGTTIFDASTNKVIVDLTKDLQEYTVVHGGRGGKGNKAFATHENVAPKFSENGEPGEEKLVRLELKVLADVGLIGMPSVGKSTLLSVISSSKPKIASYHFTTLSPNLGVVNLKDKRKFVMADLPGLIEGASEGVGLGIEFLKHAMRCRILLHLVDMSGSEGRDPIEDYKVIRNEICKYSQVLEKKKEIVVASKMDLDNSLENLEKFKKVYKDLEIYPISSYTNQGIDELLTYLMDSLENIEEVNLYEEETDEYRLYKFIDKDDYEITKDNDIWVIKGEKIEKLLLMTKFNESEGVKRFAKKLKSMQIDENLKKLGAKDGDSVAILDYMFTFNSGDDYEEE